MFEVRHLASDRQSSLVSKAILLSRLLQQGLEHLVLQIVGIDNKPLSLLPNVHSQEAFWYIRWGRIRVLIIRFKVGAWWESAWAREERSPSQVASTPWRRLIWAQVLILLIRAPNSALKLAYSTLHLLRHLNLRHCQAQSPRWLFKTRWQIQLYQKNEIFMLQTHRQLEDCSTQLPSPPQQYPCAESKKIKLLCE